MDKRERTPEAAVQPCARGHWRTDEDGLCRRSQGSFTQTYAFRCHALDAVARVLFGNARSGLAGLPAPPKTLAGEAAAAWGDASVEAAPAWGDTSVEAAAAWGDASVEAAAQGGAGGAGGEGRRDATSVQVVQGEAAAVQRCKG